MIKLPEDYSYIEMNPQLELALDNIINTSENLHIIGPAGVGKSTLIKIISDGRILKGTTVVVAPTGIAAVNASSHGISATTIHSLLKLAPLTIYPDSLLRIKEELEGIIPQIDNLIMDEASMCNASLFDFMIEQIRLYRAKKEKDLPRIFIVADPFQLPPVISKQDQEVKKYFDILYGGKYMYFSSLAFKDLNFVTIQLNKIYRQKDSSIQNILNRIRQGTQTSEDLDILNQQVISEQDFAIKRKSYLYISMYNQIVDEVNQSFLEVLDNPEYTFRADIKGNFDTSLARHLNPTVTLRKGYQVMVTKNSKDGPQDYANGTIGSVKEVYDYGPYDDQYVVIETDSGRNIKIPRGDFSQYELVKNQESGEIELKETGKFNQILVRGAHALTVHKTQGITLDSLYFDMGKFIGTAGITYVALSRAKTLEGIGLSRKLRKNDILVNKEVLDFLSKLG